MTGAAGCYWAGLPALKLQRLLLLLTLSKVLSCSQIEGQPYSTATATSATLPPLSLASFRRVGETFGQRRRLTQEDVVEPCFTTPSLQAALVEEQYVDVLLTLNVSANCYIYGPKDCTVRYDPLTVLCPRLARVSWRSYLLPCVADAATPTTTRTATLAAAHVRKCVIA